MKLSWGVLPVALNTYYVTTHFQSLRASGKERFFALGTISVLRALLSSRVVHGPRAHVEHRRGAVAILHNSLKRPNLAAHAVDNIEEQVALRATSRAKD